MKRLLRYVAAAAIPLLAGNWAFGSIQNSKHDFSAATWSDKEICKPCHTPHNADVTITGRLWAHSMSSATYVYHGGTMATPNDGSTSGEAGAKTATQNDMDGATRLCLSCHDGTVALDSFMGKAGASDGKFIGDADGQHGASTANLGNGAVANDLTNDHPVGYNAAYNESSGVTIVGGVATGHYRYKPKAAVTAAGLKLAISKTAVTAGTVDRTTGAAVTGNLPSVSCVTCHDVHNGAGNTDGLLRISNQGSALVSPVTTNSKYVNNRWRDRSDRSRRQI